MKVKIKFKYKDKILKWSLKNYHKYWDWVILNFNDKYDLNFYYMASITEFKQEIKRIIGIAREIETISNFNSNFDIRTWITICNKENEIYDINSYKKLKIYFIDKIEWAKYECKKQGYLNNIQDVILQSINFEKVADEMLKSNPIINYTKLDDATLVWEKI